MEKLVTIATFDFPVAAETVKLLLEEEGFEVILADDFLVGMDWFLSNAVGGVKLQVVESEAERAVRFVEGIHEAAGEGAQSVDKSDVAFSCPECDQALSFAAKRRGSVETCPHCQEYVDVPE